MPKFWPSLKNIKSSDQVKFKSDNLVNKLKHLIFTHEDNLSDVPNTNLTYIESINQIRIELIVDQYKDFDTNFKWLNVNYFMSNFNQFGLQIEYSFWYVKNCVPKYHDNRLYKVEYLLELDQWHTFYDYIWNSSGNIEINQMHNSRWIKDKDDNYIADLMNNPFIQNCNEFCSRFNNKQEITDPIQLIDSKHINFDLEPNSDFKDFFNVDTDKNVTTQVRGWILVWCDKDKSGEFVVSLFDKVAIPFKLFVYPIYDNFDQNKWISGIKKIQENGYRIQLSNLISDILVYEELQKTNFDGWYESSSNNFRTNITNGFIDNSNDFIDKFTFNENEIRNEIKEPHINCLTHTHYEISNINKNTIQFDINRMIKNQGYIRNPNESHEEDQPLNIDQSVIKVFQLINYNQIVYKSNNEYYLFNKNNSFSIVYSYLDGWSIQFNQSSTSRDPFTKKIINPVIRKINNQELLSYDENTRIQNIPITLELVQNIEIDGKKIQDLPHGSTKGIVLDFNWIKNTENVIGFPIKILDYGSDWINGTNQRISAFYSRFPFTVGGQHYEDSDLSNPGPYNNSVMGYDITAYSNKRYIADKWFVEYNSKIYRFPIGQLLPKQVNKYSSDFFWYDKNIIVLTKNIGYFSPEEMGLKNVLLDTDTSTASKLNKNVLSMNVKGSYTYPFVNENYNEFLKNNLNQFNASYANIDAKQSLGKQIAEQNFGLALGTSSLTGALGGFIKGGPIGAGAGALGGLLTGAVSGGVKLSQQLKQIDLEANMNRNSLNAKINDAKNIADNISTTGTASTLTDTILKEYVTAQSIFKNYWNFWLPVIHKFELTNPDKESIKLYFNKFGYEQDRFININSFDDLCTRWAFNRIKITNPRDLLKKQGLNDIISSNVAQDLLNGIWVWDIDKVDYENILDYSINNYELDFWIPPAELKHALEDTIDKEVN